MTSFRIASLVGLLAVVSARAEQADRRLSAPPTVDTSPTGYACTVETLLDGSTCVFESDAAPTGPEAQHRSMADLGEKICAAAARPPGEARPDPGVQAVCVAEVRKSVRRCADDKAPLLDGAGRFLPSARACYAALGDVLARARTLAATVAPCCRCLAEERCGDARACVMGGLGKALSGAAGKCASRSCSVTCGPYIPREEDPEEESGEGPRVRPGHRSTPLFHTPPSATKDI